MSRHHDVIHGTPRWETARAFVLDRDGHACTRCDSAERLQVDHIIPLAQLDNGDGTYDEAAYDPANLQTLCRTCHDEKGRGDGEPIRLAWVHPDYADLIGDAVFSGGPSEPLDGDPDSPEVGQINSVALA